MTWRTHRCFHAPAFLIAVFFGTADASDFEPQTLQAIPDTLLIGSDDRWSHQFMPPGPVGPPDQENRSIQSAIHFDDLLIVAGDFAWMNGEPFDGIAAWNGEAWVPSPIPRPPGARLIRVADRLYADVFFGDSPIAEWNGTAWASLPWEKTPGTSFDGFDPMALLDDSLFGVRTDAYYVSRSEYRYEASVVRWHGGSWKPAGDGIASGTPSSMTVFRNTLFACGYLSLDDTQSSRWGTAQWTGSRWEPFAEVDGDVRGFAVYGEDLIAFGGFQHIGGTRALGVARWDGESWHALGTGLDNTTGTPLVRSVSVDRFDRRALYVSGHFTLAGGKAADGLAYWNGNAWQSLVSIAEEQGGHNIRQILPYRGKLYAEGNIQVEEGLRQNELLQWNGTFWDWPGWNRAYAVESIEALLPVGNFIYAAGEFRFPFSPVTAHRVARWDGEEWTAIGASMDGVITALASYDGRLVAAGYFSRIGGEDMGGIAAWDGSDWSPLGAGANGDIYCLQSFRGQLVAGGMFDNMDGITARGIASWNGRSWKPLGEGISGPGYNWIADMTLHDGMLAVCGNFEWAGTQRSSPLALWDGEAWFSVGDPGVGGSAGASVNRITSYRDRLFFAAYNDLDKFFPAQTFERPLVLASWDGQVFTPIRDCPAQSIDAMETYGSYLAMGVNLDSRAFEYPYDENLLILYDGHRWLRTGPLGLWDGEFGFGSIDAIAAKGTHLFAGGSFYFAGNIPSFNFAQWDGMTFPPTQPAMLLAATPNPVRDGVVLSWSLENAGHVDLRIFDLQGREVAVVENGDFPSGDGEGSWDLKSRNGERVPAGIYFARIALEDDHAVQKLVVLP